MYPLWLDPVKLLEWGWGGVPASASLWAGAGGHVLAHCTHVI